MTDVHSRNRWSPWLQNRIPQIQRTWATLSVALLPCLFGLVFAVAVGCVADGRRAGQVGASAPRRQAPAKKPHFDARTQQVQYAGPGREIPPPEDVEEIRIGYFGPADPDHPTAGMMWLAAMMAVEEANEAGGYDGIPFTLLPCWSENPWGTGVRDLTRLVYDDKVWAIVGAPDGPSAHLATQVVTKARLTFLSPVATDKTTNLANVPWVFSLAPGDHLLAPPLAEALVTQVAAKPFAVVSCTDHDSRMFTTELLRALEKLQAFPSHHLHFRPETTDFATQLQAVRQAQPAAVALVAGPRDAARFVAALWREGSDTPIFGDPRMGRRLFAERDDQFAGDLTFPLLWDRSFAGEYAATFARRFARRFGVEPDYTAAQTYDAMTLLITAIREAGLNRVLIRDAVRELSPWPGVSGEITWDPTGQNDRWVRCGTMRK
jgi:branched-chain amino acid transport system substrate-binding protein